MNNKNEQVIRNADKIYEAYIGKLGQELKEMTQKRFSWISNQVKGYKVLDIGCSSGIFPILIAREGREVIGVDLDPIAIENANKLKEQEAEDVQNNVEFTLSSVDSYDTEDKFDTIILAEIIEHLYYPEEILRKVSNWLNDDGVLIVTVPFGLNNYFDHKKYYYLSILIEELSDLYFIEKIDYISEWIGVVCYLKTEKRNIKTDIISIELLKKFEAAVLNKEKKWQNLYLKVLELNKSHEKTIASLNDAMLIENKKQLNLLEEYEKSKIYFDELIKNQKKGHILSNDLLDKLETNKIYFEELIKDQKQQQTNFNEIIQVKEQNISKLLNIITENNNKIQELSDMISGQNKEMIKNKEKILCYEKKILELEDTLRRFNKRKIIVIIRKIKNLIIEFKKTTNNIIGKIKKLIRKIIEYFKKICNSIFKNRLISLLRKQKNIISNEERINEKFYNNIENLIKGISKSNGSNFYEKFNVKIGIITDEYMYNYYKDAVELVYIEYNEYEKAVDYVDMVLFISCWKGMKGNDWRGISGEKGQTKLIEIFNYAKKQNKKIIFQTIEDPSNYDRYLPVAKEADYIFTTAAEMIESYKKDTKNNNVFYLDYGVNPLFHNPIGFKASSKQKKQVFFAGSWAPRYKERCDDAEVLFDGVIESGHNLVLADRNYYIKGYEYPTKYNKYIIPAIEHKMLQSVHKLFDWSLNLNSIKYSPTMCAMRVYELQALGNLMISNYSMAVNNIFPNIFIANSSFEVSRILNSYEDNEIYKMQVDGIRNVMSNHTVFDKLDYVFECINEAKYKKSYKKVLVVCEKITNKIKREFSSQTYEHKELTEIFKLNKNIIKEYDYISYFSEEIVYKKAYLEDMINAFKYTDSDFITIDSSIIDNKIVGINHDYVNESKNIEKVVFDANRYNYEEVFNEWKIEGNGYSIDPFSIMDYDIDIEFKKEISVIVPIYNNGKFLIYKCFNSLFRSSIFNNLEIILVDDGSNDKETIEIIKEIENKFKNVKTYFFNDGGSGSASRPRNKGIELATTKYIAYLDPDNEAINDGYAKLYDKIKKSNYDFVFGSIIKLSDHVTKLSYNSKSYEINNPKQELINKNFKTNSIQACIIRKDLIIKNKIQNPIGAAGQDSLFFQELMINAKSVYYINLPIHIYYASRSDSIVNTINSKFFDKFFILEKYQVEKLKEYGLLGEYKKRRYYNFLENWYYEKLKLVVNNEERIKSEKTIKEIEQLYEL